jgi:hypothetical protein
VNTLFPGGTLEAPFLSAVPEYRKRTPDLDLKAQDSLASAEAFARAGNDVQVNVPIDVSAASL